VQARSVISGGWVTLKHQCITSQHYITPT